VFRDRHRPSAEPTHNQMQFTAANDSKSPFPKSLVFAETQALGRFVIPLRHGLG
jgi:hypothetical protein